MSKPPPLDRVDIWTTVVEEAATPERLAEYQQLLAPDEHQRHDRFLRHDDRVRFLIGRALARTVLSSYVAVDPTAWTIAVDPHGRPELAAIPSGVPDLRFNLSHTEGLVACAVTVGRDIGVDVEHVGRHVTHDVAERFFAPDEVDDLRSLAPDEQPRAFFDYWTLKEAYIKARGLGLALPLRQFSFRRTGGAPTIHFSPPLHDDAASWQFAQFWPTRVHRLAVAVRRTGGDLPIDLAPVVPGAAT